MIYISEINPIKMSGETSLLIDLKEISDFELLKKIEAALDDITVPVWHKKIFSFEVPVIHLSDILDRLTYLDDIKLKLLEDDLKVKYSNNINDYPN